MNTLKKKKKKKIEEISTTTHLPFFFFSGVCMGEGGLDVTRANIYFNFSHCFLLNGD